MFQLWKEFKKVQKVENVLDVVKMFLSETSIHIQKIKNKNHQMGKLVLLLKKTSNSSK